MSAARGHRGRAAWWRRPRLCLARAPADRTGGARRDGACRGRRRSGTPAPRRPRPPSRPRRGRPPAHPAAAGVARRHAARRQPSRSTDRATSAPSATTRALFDYFLSATGEEPPETIRARIVATIERRLPPAAVADAVALLDRYLAYRERARELAARRPRRGAARRRGSRRSRSCGARSSASPTPRRCSARRRHATGPRSHDGVRSPIPALAPDERARRARRGGRRACRSRSAGPSRGRDAARCGSRRTRPRCVPAAARTRRCSACARQQVGTEAAARLAALDRERADWQARLDAYRAARAAIDADRPAPRPIARGRATPCWPSVSPPPSGCASRRSTTPCAAAAGGGAASAGRRREDALRDLGALRERRGLAHVGDAASRPPRRRPPWRRARGARPCPPSPAPGRSSPRPPR